MSLARLPSSIRATAVRNLGRKQTFHSSSPARASVLFALGALSNSRETVHFNKISRLPRIEHSPPLKLIKTSEIDPHPLPTPPKPSPASSAWTTTRPGSATKVWDDRALSIGRVLLSNQARQSRKLRNAFIRARRRQAMQDTLVKKERLSWQRERSRLQKDIRAAGYWILASVATATVLATWRFFPGVSTRPSSADLGSKIAARAASAMPLPAAVASEQLPTNHAMPPSTAVHVDKEITHAMHTSPIDVVTRSWWKGLFWKQQ